MDEETLQNLEKKLEDLWDSIQLLKEKDEFAAQCLYEKYKRIAIELPPSIPTEAVMPTM